mgnify:FL=1
MTIVQDPEQDIAAGLVTAQAADGGWSTVSGGPPDTESTAWAAMALADRTGDASRAALSGRDWLLRHQRPDGAWPVWPSVPVPGWTTSLAVLSLAGAEDGAATAGAEWLLGSRASRASWSARTLIRLGWIEPSVELDHSLTGFPWVPDTFSWVEPTSWAILALRALRGRLSETEWRSRSVEAVELLLERACGGGGWYYGKRPVLGVDLWPYPDTTAIALLALVDAGDHPAVTAGFRSLDEMLAGRASRLSLSLGVLARRAHGGDARDLQSRLEEAWAEEEIVAPTTRVQALSLLALSSQAWPAPVSVEES